MAITTTTIAGTDSLSGSRITINDNFKTLENALNDVLSAFDIVSGRFDNSTYGSSNDMITNGITITGTGLTNALTVNNGNINVLLGDVKITDNYGFYIGSLLKLNRVNVPETVGSGNYPAWDLRAPGGTADQVAGLVLPRLTAAGFTAIGPTSSIPDGLLVFTEQGPGLTPLKLWWENGPSGATWYNVTVTA